MSGDENLLLFASGIVALACWGVWYLWLLRLPRLGSRGAPRRLLTVVPGVCAVLLYLVLTTAAARDVRDSEVYLTLYLVFGLAWVGIGAHALRLFGLSARDDVIERDNESAALAIGGALVALTLCFAGGNIGDGPGWWVVLFSGLLATGSLGVLWYALDRATAVADQVTIERDPAAGARLAGFLVACGLVLGRAVAGDWVSADATVRDFGAAAWPVLPLLVVAIGVDRAARRTPERPTSALVAQGIAPALLYVGLVLVHVVLLGPID